MRTTTTMAALGVLAAVLAACGGGGDDDEEADTTTTEDTTTTTALDTTGFAAFSWSSPQPLGVGLDWTMADCEGDEPKLCLTHPDGRHATVEHLRFQGEIAAVEISAHATKFVEEFTKDRTTGCGSGYQVIPEEPEHLFLADGPALRYGFSGGAGGPSGSITERTIQWGAIREGTLVLVTISGYDPGSCLSPEGEGTRDDVEELLPGIEALITAIGMPTTWP
jgi:hypothetical protein